MFTFKSKVTEVGDSTFKLGDTVIGRLVDEDIIKDTKSSGDCVTIDKDLLSINHSSLVDSNNKPIFASLRKDGLGGNLLKANFIDVDLVAIYDEVDNQFVAVLEIDEDEQRKYPITDKFTIVGERGKKNE